MEILIKSGHLPWARKDQNVKEIGLEKLFNEYWTSKEHDLTLSGQSSFPTILLTSDKAAQRALSLENIVAISSYISLRAPPFVICNHPSHPAHNARIGGPYSRVARRTRRIAIKRTPPHDGYTDGEGCGQSY